MVIAERTINLTLNIAIDLTKQKIVLIVNSSCQGVPVLNFAQ